MNFPADDFCIWLRALPAAVRVADRVDAKLSLAAEDFKEGRTAEAEGRPPVYQGK